MGCSQNQLLEGLPGSAGGRNLQSGTAGGRRGPTLLHSASSPKRNEQFVPLSNSKPTENLFQSSQQLKLELEFGLQMI